MFYFTLDENRQPQPCNDFNAYHDWHDSMPPSSDWYTMKTGLGFVVGLDEVGEERVSTVFLGINHAFGDEPPLLWETMVFPAADLCGRYRTYGEAIAGHKQAVESLRRGEFERRFHDDGVLDLNVLWPQGAK